MTGRQPPASGSGYTYQWQINSGAPFPSTAGGAAGGGGGTLSGSSMQSSLAQTSYSYREHADWSAGLGLGPGQRHADRQRQRLVELLVQRRRQLHHPCRERTPCRSGQRLPADPPHGQQQFALLLQRRGHSVSAAAGPRAKAAAITPPTAPSATTRSPPTGPGLPVQRQRLVGPATAAPPPAYAANGTYSYGPAAARAYGIGLRHLHGIGRQRQQYSYGTDATLGASGWAQTGWQTDQFLQAKATRTPPGGGWFNIPSPAGEGRG